MQIINTTAYILSNTKCNMKSLNINKVESNSEAHSHNLILTAEHIVSKMYRLWTANTNDEWTTSNQ